MLPQDSDSVSLDFQSSDQAWYTIRLILQGEELTVKFCNFDETFDDQFNAADFKDNKALDDFIRRFRLTSVQLQDNECRKVRPGMTVCASYLFSQEDLRFYDAVVHSVNHKDHKFDKEELCTCSFELFWLVGPNAGKTLETSVADICVIQSGNVEIDPTLSRFLEMCREKQNGVASSINANKLCSPRFESQASPWKVGKMCKHSVSTTRRSTSLSFDHDERKDMELGKKYKFIDDLGKTPSLYFLVIENLEKDLSSMSIVDFLKNHLSISSEAQVFPSMSWESYTRGIITVDSKEELQKLSDFLTSPARLVLSSRGRPWVISEKKFCRVAVGEIIRNSTMLAEESPQGKSRESGDQIRIVTTASEEYKKGKRLKDLFLEFADHQQGLHRRLTSEESKILQKQL